MVTKESPAGEKWRSSSLRLGSEITIPHSKKRKRYIRSRAWRFPL